MPSNNLDDLFRQHLGGHATPPGADLQRRLAELAEAERLDSLFRTGLGGHASQPRRAVWERLEDEHLHPAPRRRRVVAWWQLSAAAVLLLSLLAGGLLWQSGREARPGSGLATNQPAGTKAGNAPLPAMQAATSAAATPANDFATTNTTEKEVVAHTSPSTAEKLNKSFASQATARVASPSSTPIATTTRAGRAATATRAANSHRLPRRALDAAPGQLASHGGRKSPVDQPMPATTTVAPATTPAPSPALVAATMTNPSEVVEVEVRRGPAPAPPTVVVASAAATEPIASPRRRLRLGGLLRQADHLVHGEPVSLTEATGLAQTVTVQARLGGRTLSRTIQL